MRHLALLFILSSAVLVGCGTTPPQADSAQPVLNFSADRYPDVFDAAVWALRDHGFEIERRDYRFGIITTKPKESATALEFWIDDATTADQSTADTLNAQQRTVTIRVDRQIAEEALEDALGSANPPDEIENDAPDPPPSWQYTLTVEVVVQRLQRPNRYLTHSVTGRLTTAYAATPAHLRGNGLDGPYAQTLTRDPYLERRLIQAILDTVNE